MTARLSDRSRRLLTIAFVMVLALPLFGVDDSVPLSSYPMYARPRADTLSFVTAVGFDARGAEIELSTRQIADTRDPLIAETWLRGEVGQGRAASACAAIASRSGDQVVAVEIRREQHLVAERAQGNDSLLERSVVAACAR